MYVKGQIHLVLEIPSIPSRNSYFFHLHVVMEECLILLRLGPGLLDPVAHTDDCNSLLLILACCLLLKPKIF